MLVAEAHFGPSTSTEFQASAHKILPQTEIECLELVPRADFPSILSIPDRSPSSLFGRPLTAFEFADHSTFALNGAVRAFGAFVGGRLRGLSQITASTAGHIEARLVADPSWGNRGVGGALLRAAIQQAHQSNTRIIRLIIARDNWPMRALACKAGAQFNLVFGEIYADIATASPTAKRGKVEFD